MTSSNLEVQPGAEPAPAQAIEPAAEKLIPQSQVNDLVGRVKGDAYDRGKRDAMAELQKQSPIAQAQPAQMQQPMQQQMGGMQQFSQEDIKRLIEEHAPRALAHQVDVANSNRIVQTFVNKMEAAKEKYPNLEKDLAELNLPGIPHIVQMASGVDNAADVMNDLKDNPVKIAQLTQLFQLNPALAHKEFLKLSGSIKTNQAAAGQASPNEPLSQVKPSPVAGNGSLTVDDYQSQPWLRG